MTAAILGASAACGSDPEPKPEQMAPGVNASTLEKREQQREQEEQQRRADRRARERELMNRRAAK